MQTSYPALRNALPEMLNVYIVSGCVQLYYSTSPTTWAAYGWAAYGVLLHLQLRTGPFEQCITREPRATTATRETVCLT